MHDEADVGLVDPHPERVRRHHDFAAALHERLLGGSPLLGQQPGMIHARPPLPPTDHNLRDFLGPLPGRSIDDPRARRSGKQLQQQIRLLPLGGWALDFVEQVRPGKTGDESPRLAEIELLDDIPANPVGGRGRQGDGGRVAQHPPEMAQPSVIGPEVVAPLADTVRLVDRHQTQTGRTHGCEKPLAAEALGHHVHQAVLSAGHVFQPRGLLPHRQRAVDVRNRQAQTAELIHLILHQRDQRRDHQRQSVQHHRRQLVAKALAAAGGHHAKAILAGQQRRDHLALPRPKAGQSEPRQVRRGIPIGSMRHRRQPVVKQTKKTCWTSTKRP